MRIGRYAARTGVATAAAGMVALGIGGTAHAQEDAEPKQDSEPKVIEGDCATTLKNEDGKPLTIDALAAVKGGEDVAPIGTGEGDDAALSLPVKETLDGLGVSGADNSEADNVVVNSLGQVCDAAQSTVNAVGDVTRGATDLSPDEPDDPDRPEQPDQPEQPAPPEKPAPEPDEPEAPEPAPPEPAPDDATPPAADVPPPPAPEDGAAPDPLDAIALPPAAGIEPPKAPKAPVGPGMDTPEKGSQPEKQKNTTRKSGTAEALPQASEQDRTPLVLSVAALLVVIAGLSRAWVARKNP